MNMHGFIAPAQDAQQQRHSLFGRLVAWIRAHVPFMLIVVVPTLLVAAYFYLIAANQYETEAHFVVQSSEGNTVPSSFGDILGFSAPISPTQSQAMGVSDYLESQEIVDTLQKNLGLATLFRRPEADFVSTLHPANPTPERLFEYYKSKVQIRYDRDTGISTVRVRAFRPGDSYTIIHKLLELGEERVNQLNQRAFNDAVRLAEAQVRSAERNTADIEAQMTQYRQMHSDINPTASGQAQTTLLTTLQGELAASRAQLVAMGTMISHASPQYRALQQHVDALQAEVGRQEGRLTGGQNTVASKLGGYESLVIEQQFAAKRYDAASAALEKARDQARRQSLYLLRIVNPAMPVKSLYPRRGMVTLTVFISLLVSYWIGWLIVAGVREHSL